MPGQGRERDFLERSIWNEIENFLRHPGAVIDQLRQRLDAERSDSKRNRERLGRLEDDLAAKGVERDRLLNALPKGRINDEDLDRQMDQMEREEAGIRANIEDLSAGLRGLADATAQLQSTQALLEKLRDRLEQGIPSEVKRQLVEALVGNIRINTVEENGKRCACIVVTYGSLVQGTCTDTRACSNWCLERVFRPPTRRAA